LSEVSLSELFIKPSLRNSVKDTKKALKISALCLFGWSRLRRMYTGKFRERKRTWAVRSV